MIQPLIMQVKGIAIIRASFELASASLVEMGEYKWNDDVHKQAPTKYKWLKLVSIQCNSFKIWIHVTPFKGVFKNR